MRNVPTTGIYRTESLTTGTSGYLSIELGSVTVVSRERYSYRMGTVEPVFANLRHAKGMNRINYRGREKVGVIWKLWCMMHNIEKIVLYSPEYGVK